MIQRAGTFFFTEAELAKRAGLSPSTIRGLRLRGKIHPVGTVSSGGNVYDFRTLDELRGNGGKFETRPTGRTPKPDTSIECRPAHIVTRRLSDIP